MSEWFKEQAWKAILAMRTKRRRNTSQRNRFNDLHQQDAPRCDSVNVRIRRRFRAPPYTVLTRFSVSLTDLDRRHLGGLVEPIERGLLRVTSL